MFVFDIAIDVAVDIASATPSPNILFRTTPALTTVADANRFALSRMFPPSAASPEKTGGVTRRSRRLCAGNHCRESGPDNIWDKS
ncbi:MULTISPECIES: hypothetical protein [unclassified Burkholderia]|uniref:hypothetical protein n=1 Tax=unclassified Burkholderia TaxID=2613784 RepID=UPI0020134AC1|nr:MULTISPECIES: hypothetical protein [unclassified Burkholderia]